VKMVLSNRRKGTNKQEMFSTGIPYFIIVGFLNFIPSHRSTLPIMLLRACQLHLRESAGTLFGLSPDLFYFVEMISSENQPASLEFDPAALDRLRKIGGRKLVAGILDIFLNQTPERLAVILSAFQTGNFDTLGKTAHSLKSSAGNVGATKLQQIAESLETGADRPQPEISSDSINVLERLAKNAVVYFLAQRKEIDL